MFFIYPTEYAVLSIGFKLLVYIMFVSGCYCTLTLNLSTLLKMYLGMLFLLSSRPTNSCCFDKPI